MAIRAGVRMVLAAVIAAGLAGCAGSGGTFAEAADGVDPGWLQFRVVQQTAHVEPGESGAADASVDSLADVWEKVGIDAAELAQSLSQAPTEPDSLEILEPFSRLAPSEVELLPLEVRLYVPLIHCDQLKPSVGYHTLDEEAVACEPVNQKVEKLHLGQSELDGSHVAVADSHPVPSDPAQYQIIVEMTDEGARRLVDLTGEHVDERLAILLADRVVTAPVITGPIAGGVVQITGGFTRQEADDLVRVINSATKAPG